MVRGLPSPPPSAHGRPRPPQKHPERLGELQPSSRDAGGTPHPIWSDGKLSRLIRERGGERLGAVIFMVTWTLLVGCTQRSHGLPPWLVNTPIGSYLVCGSWWGRNGLCWQLPVSCGCDWRTFVADVGSNSWPKVANKHSFWLARCTRMHRD